MYWKMLRFDQAISELREALRIDPSFDQARFYLADSYLATQKAGEALTLLQNLVKERPRDYRTRVALGKTFRKLGRPQEAQREFRTAIQLDPDTPDAHFQLAQAYKALNQAAEYRQELAITQKLQQRKRTEAETLLRAAGSRGDPTRQLNLVPSPP
jgi:tetratricopeptide (TPR) repeat protein